MSVLENAGAIFKCSHRENAFRWELPNYFAWSYPVYDDDDNDTFKIDEINPRHVSSPSFSAFNHKWRLAFVVNQDEYDRTEVHVGLFLWMMSSSDRTPNIRVKLCILDGDREYKSCDHEVDFNGHFGSWNFLSFSRFNKYRFKLSPNGVLRISCTLDKKVTIVSDTPKSNIVTTSKVEDPDSDEKDEKNNESEPKGVDRLLLNLKSLLLDEQSSDVLLKIEDRDFKVHRAILKARSAVFASMFQPHTKESTTGVVDIPDCSASAFEILLLYIYTGSADAISSDIVFDLYYAADKYQMDDLKAECVDFMKNNLSVDNFCKIMTLSLQHSEKGLQETAIEFFRENVKTIIKTVQWQKYLKDYSTQANELFIKVFNA